MAKMAHVNVLAKIGLQELSDVKDMLEQDKLSLQLINWSRNQLIPMPLYEVTAYVSNENDDTDKFCIIGDCLKHIGTAEFSDPETRKLYEAVDAFRAVMKEAGFMD